KKTKNIAMVLALALSLVLITAVVPVAAKGKPDKPPIPDHPDGLTCAEAEYGGYEEAQTLTDGGVLEVGADRVCVDWTTTEESEWVVTVADPGRAKDVIMSLRDSHPGDFCWQGKIDLKRGATEVTMAHTMGSNATGGAIPKSVTDACGDVYTDSAASYVLIIELSGRPTTALITIEPAE
ncbi:MAG: hypothetical protein V3R84_10555, partial [Acidimicrobiia bacterium]